MKVSVCIPVYNGAGTIKRLVDEIFSTLNTHFDIEVVLVNDCSPDNSDEICRQLAVDHEHVKYISLRKNYGEHNAVMCALNYSTGDYVAIVDDDFQNPPHEIVKLVDEAKHGIDVVYSKYNKKEHHFLRNLGSWFNGAVSNWLLDKPKDLYLSSFKLICRDIVNEIIKYKGPSPYIDGLILRATNSISAVYVTHDKRHEGQSSYTLKKLISLWLNMFINFSIKPLRIFSLFGMVVTAISFIAAMVFILQKIINPDLQLGWTSVIVSILFFSGVQIVFLGLIGEYVGKHYLQSNGTPQWTVKKEYI
jgi:undecaprenyl-phosphate 4-deoxy-4-formamido-L-arabinose transferase